MTYFRLPTAPAIQYSRGFGSYPAAVSPRTHGFLSSHHNQLGHGITCPQHDD